MHEKNVQSIFEICDDYILQDLDRWVKRLKIENYGRFEAFKTCFTTRQEFRSIIQYRIQNHEDKSLVREFINDLNPTPHTFVTNLYLSCKQIGPGLYIEHGFSSIVFAKSIGSNFHLNQNVTIGSGKGGIPTIGNNVSVHCNSVLIGGIKVGNNVKVAAGSVVVDNVPDNCVVASPKAVVIKKL